MTAPLALTKDNLLNLLCNQCKKFLSVPPIHIINGNFICGRCDSSGERITIYEEFAKLMTFPCINEPCPAQLKWGQVKNHENNCPYKVLACPKPNCTLNLKANEFHHHFLIKHKELLHKNQLQLKRSLRDLPLKNFNTDKGAYLLHHENQSYLVMVYGTCKEDDEEPGYIGSYSYNFGVFYLYKTDKTKAHYDLTVTVTDEDGVDTNYSWHNQLLRQYTDEHCLGCLDNNCYKGGLVNRKSEMFLWNTIENIENYACNYVIKYSVKLVDDEPVSELASSFENVSLASKFECPICYEYLSTPIYICTNGHSLCSKCKVKVNTCALCQAVVGNSRNYTLEQITETLEICCPNAPKGCSHTGKIKSTQQHLLNCKYNCS